MYRLRIYGVSRFVALGWFVHDVDPPAWLADVLARIADHPIRRLDELLPWRWRKPATVHSPAAA
jgi:hypothetical protein